ncbi:hypothetical protein [Streptomyces sp. NPDC057748]|uniref:hypothetical protein n=1 Tax=unclassified Streptomyces TaxID=2593676 RepID=UPI0036CDD809
MAEVFRRTNMDRDERARTSGAARKAAGNILREVLTGDELEAYGLMQASPAERSRAAHQNQWVPAEVARLAKTSPATDVRADPVRLMQGALGVLLRVSSDAVAALSDEERANFAQLALRIEDRAYDLRMSVTPSDD